MITGSPFLNKLCLNDHSLLVAPALLEKEGLWKKAGLDAAVLTDPQSDLKIQVWNAPKQVPPEVTFFYKDRAWIVTASGGVQINSW